MPYMDPMGIYSLYFSFSRCFFRSFCVRLSNACNIPKPELRDLKHSKTRASKTLQNLGFPMTCTFPILSPFCVRPRHRKVFDRHATRHLPENQTSLSAKMGKIFVTFLGILGGFGVSWAFT